MSRSAGRQVVDCLVADLDDAARDALKPGDDAQQRGLAAAGRADQHYKLAVPDINADALKHLDRAEGLYNVLDPDLSHRHPANIINQTV